VTLKTGVMINYILKYIKIKKKHYLKLLFYCIVLFALVSIRDSFKNVIILPTQNI